ncbi:zona pellucida sperm-binding protein 3-like [Mugil cephalus]|uniref:zona pellucida sperm-binding protein 3-like n=1 Tax=Mugil cephalus TaxID=48193 RepID=UPI001FB854CB|nr:zona pellucida sperm-binding protein 3-like [Mugil cephalus]
MDRGLQRLLPWCFIVFFSVPTLAESRLVYNRGPAIDSQYDLLAIYHEYRQPAVKQQQSAELGVQPRPVVVKCHPDSMEVVVQADMFDTGLRVDGRHLRLGLGAVSEGSDCGAVPSGEEEFTIHVWLVDCGSKLSPSKEDIIYSNVLVYSPQPSSDGLFRLDGAVIPVECHYERKYSMDKISLHPTWVSFISRASADDQINFNLLHMTDDWQFERGSHTYFLGDPIRFEASAIIGNHLPLRVFVDRCVATATPDTEAALRYVFIDGHGCLADAFLTNSSSRFLPRVEEHKLRFQLDAFKFYQQPNNQVYVTCYMKAVPVTSSVSSRNRACSFIQNRWQSVDGNDQVCRSCDASHPEEEPTSPEPPKTTMSTNAWPTTTLQESLHNRPQHQPAKYIRFRPEAHPSQHNKPQQPSAKLVKRGTDYKAEQTVQLGPLIVLPSSRFVTKPAASKKVISPQNNTA